MGKSRPAGDGVVRIRREIKGRRGKTVTILSGVPLDALEIRLLTSELKRRLGTGGSVKDGIIVIQGDHRNTLADELQKRGFSVKFAGG
jgi:translation initiation factor 1